MQQRIVDLKDAAAEAENAFRIARLRYDEGEEDLLSVLTIQQRVNRNLALGGSWAN